jgi:hypothetical protein
VTDDKINNEKIFLEIYFSGLPIVKSAYVGDFEILFMDESLYYERKCDSYYLVSYMLGFKYEEYVKQLEEKCPVLAELR